MFLFDPIAKILITRIISLVDGGPAAKSGQILANDLIIGIAQSDGEMVDTIGYSTREIVALIRGTRGTEVTVKGQTAKYTRFAGQNGYFGA